MPSALQAQEWSAIITAAAAVIALFMNYLRDGTFFGLGYTVRLARTWRVAGSRPRPARRSR